MHAIPHNRLLIMTFKLPGNQPLLISNNLSYCGRKPNVWNLGISWWAWRRTLFACWLCWSWKYFKCSIKYKKRESLWVIEHVKSPWFTLLLSVHKACGQVDGQESNGYCNSCSVLCRDGKTCWNGDHVQRLIRYLWQNDLTKGTSELKACDSIRSGFRSRCPWITI